ncbi:MAG: hypothetical protein ACI9U2_004375, partial [Bradymonadia bacterium]
HRAEVIAQVQLARGLDARQKSIGHDGSLGGSAKAGMLAWRA